MATAAAQIRYRDLSKIMYLDKIRKTNSMENSIEMEMDVISVIATEIVTIGNRTNNDANNCLYRRHNANICVVNSIHRFRLC